MSERAQELESHLVTRLLRYGIRAAVSLLIMMFVFAVSFQRFGGFVVSTSIHLPAAWTGLGAAYFGSPREMRVTVFRSRVEPEFKTDFAVLREIEYRNSLAPGQARDTFTHVPVVKIEYLPLPFGIDFLSARLRLSVAVTAFCGCGVSWLLLRFFRRRRRSV